MIQILVYLSKSNSWHVVDEVASMRLANTKAGAWIRSGYAVRLFETI